MSYHSSSSFCSDDEDNDSIDPSEAYNLEDFAAEQDILDRIGERIGEKLKAKIEACNIERTSRRSGPRTHIPRDHEAAHKALVNDYFSERPLCTDKMFRRRFAEGVIEVFGDEYLRHPRSDELEHLLEINEFRGFPGMLGSIDCMHWQWEKCPNAWKGMFIRGDHGVPTMILEAVASHDLWIWHAYFGVAGSNNDINVLNQSPLFIHELQGEAPQVHFTVNGRQYNRGYYLADGIYPEWAVFVKTVPLPQLEKDKLFAKYQEGARKDVERAFGVLQSRFNIVRRPARLWKRVSIAKIMEACVILHNMIVEDGDMVSSPLDLNEKPRSCFVLPPEVNNRPNIPFQEVLQRNSDIRARPTHQQLKRDLIQHIWRNYRNKSLHQ
ncbi:hypothetical protein ACP4OV_013204 [Aristida adscensionis]